MQLPLRLRGGKNHLRDEAQKMRLNNLSGLIHLFEASQRTLPRGISLPEKDVPIFLAAIEARATHLLTGDIQHFGPYLDKRIEGIKIVLPGKYLRMRASHD